MERNELKILGVGVMVGLAAGFLLARSLYVEAARPASGPVLLGPAAPGAAPPAGPPVPAASPGPGGGGPAQDDPERAAALHAEINALIGKTKADPKDRASRVALGNITFDNGLYDLAIKYYEEALVLDGSDPSVITDLGVAYRYSRQSAKAVEHFERAVALDPNHIKGWYNIAVVKLADLSDPAGAKVALDKAMALQPDMPALKELDRLIRKAQGS